MSQEKHYLAGNWPKDITIPRAGKLHIAPSGGMTGSAGIGPACKLEDLTDEQFETACGLIHAFFNMKFDQTDLAQDGPSHCLQVGDYSFNAYNIWIWPARDPRCPDFIKNLYSFIKSPNDYIPVQTQNQTTAPAMRTLRDGPV